jgi:hypothetical protein
MRYVFRALLACTIAVGCSRTSASSDAAPATPVPADAAPAAPRIATPDQALAAFLSAWNLSVLPGLPERERPSFEAIDRAMREAPEKLSAKTEPCRESRAVVERINRETSFDFVVFGDLAALDRDGDCWRVMYEGGMKLEAIGYLDPAAGRLLLVWRVPEG